MCIALTRCYLCQQFMSVIFLVTVCCSHRYHTHIIRPVERGRGSRRSKLPRAPRRLVAPPSLKNIKHTRMCHFKKIPIFCPEGLCENVSLGPAVALDGPAYNALLYAAVLCTHCLYCPSVCLSVPYLRLLTQ